MTLVDDAPEQELAARGQLRTALLSVVAAVVLVTVKLAAGVASGSLGLVAEALHSGTDLVAAILAFFAVRVAVRPPDREHPFGHGKAQHLAALAETAFLAAASGFIAFHAVERLARGSAGEVDAGRGEPACGAPLRQPGARLQRVALRERPVGLGRRCWQPDRGARRLRARRRVRGAGRRG